MHQHSRDRGLRECVLPGCNREAGMMAAAVWRWAGAGVAVRLRSGSAARLGVYVVRRLGWWLRLAVSAG